MYKISVKGINFITETMRNWKVELAAERKTQAATAMYISNDATLLHT